jgi:hypothetical protein
MAAPARPPLAGLRKQRQREASGHAEELCEYGNLWIQETAIRVRAEILAAMRARAAQIGEELARLQHALEGVKRLFLARDPSFQESRCPAIGWSVDLLPLEAAHSAWLRESLADSFCCERRLVNLERGLLQELNELHGGLVEVLMREPRSIAEVFENSLLHRAASAVGDWLEGQDAASILQQRRGSLEGAIRDLAAAWRSLTPGLPEAPRQRLTVSTPCSPSGRSLRERLASSSTFPADAEFVAIPDDIVLCLELEELNLASAAAAIVARQPWLAELAPKLVTRHDIPWTGLDRAEAVLARPESGEDL